MKLNPQQLFYLVLVAIFVWFLYLGRGVLTPFLFAAALAYILNPLVNILTEKIRLPRTLSVLLIYLILIGSLSILSLWLGSTLGEESREFASETRVLFRQIESQISTLPAFIQPLALDTFGAVRSSLLLPNHKFSYYLPGAINRAVSVLIFLVATLYFLKDGHYLISSFLGLFPSDWRKEIEEIMHKINKVLGDYLRAQLTLVAIMSVLTYIGLSIIGVKFSLILSVFTGLAEIVPIVGPVVAAAIAMVVAYFDGISRFGLSPFVDLIAVGLLYTILRQTEDLFIAPQVMGRMIKLHPLVILFVVVAGGHLFGITGFLVAVPVVASFKVVLSHVRDLLNTAESKVPQKKQKAP